jgi:hypothetical protein
MAQPIIPKSYTRGHGILSFFFCTVKTGGAINLFFDQVTGLHQRKGYKFGFLILLQQISDVSTQDQAMPYCLQN